MWPVESWTGAVELGEANGGLAESLQSQQRGCQKQQANEKNTCFHKPLLFRSERTFENYANTTTIFTTHERAFQA
jgi:hypothetical protein